MSPASISGIVFLSVFGGAFSGLLVGNALPQHHLSWEARDVVKLGMGVVGTMTALVLGLLVASAKGSYETQKSELTQMSVTIIELDQLLTQYGSETESIRNDLRENVVLALQRIWPGSVTAERAAPAPGWASIFREIGALKPSNEDQRWLRERALQLSMELSHARWMLYEHGGTAIPTPLLVVVVVWLTLLFTSFGLFAPPNPTIVATQFVCALSVSMAIYMVLDLERPFQGLIQVSNAPLQNALTHLGH